MIYYGEAEEKPSTATPDSAPAEETQTADAPAEEKKEE